MRLLVWLIPGSTAVVSLFALGAAYGRASGGGAASVEQNMRALRAEMTAVSDRIRSVESATGRGVIETRNASDAALADLIKADLTEEMGLVPLAVLRERRSSFVAVHATGRNGEMQYGTAGHLGNGYFLTVKHLAVALGERAPAGESPARSLRIVYREKELTATLVDAGDATAEVDAGDWAIIKTEPVDLPALDVDATFDYDFAEPIVRFGNDYSKGIVAASGYVGQRTPAGLVTCLTDGHPGVSGGGVLDRRGVLVGIPIGRMSDDYRFSFILPIRAEMLRKVPGLLSSTRRGESGSPHERLSDDRRHPATGH